MRKAILKHNLLFSFRAFGESVLEDVAHIVASVFGQSSRLSFMYPSCTLILVMLTKKIRGARWANSQRLVILRDELEVEHFHLAPQASARPCAICQQCEPTCGDSARSAARPLTDFSMEEFMKKHATGPSVRKWLQIRKRKRNQGQRGLLCYSNKNNFLFPLISEPQSRILSI